jgi:hypothetical protein
VALEAFKEALEEQGQGRPGTAAGIDEISGGVLYASFRYGRGDREHGGRRFMDLDEAVLDDLLKEVPVLGLVVCWVSGDARPERGGERWFNVLLRASAGNGSGLDPATDSDRREQAP